MLTETKKRRIEMEINFNEEEVVICFDGLQITIQKDKAMDLANKIFDYFEWYD